MEVALGKERMVRYSIVVAVYNRPEELDELLDSLSHQQFKDFEVIVVEDGSALPSDAVCAKWAGVLEVRYVVQENTGPAGARNRGVLFEACRGEYVVFFDSDCIVPGNYFSICDELLRERPEVDLFGGPDAWHESFSDLQKAISYAMTSPFSTGGIRGGSELSDTFYPRTFNMGVRQSAFKAVGGFGPLRYGEDVDLSMRLVRAGYRSALFTDLFVYHRRRESYGKFFSQVYHSGAARVTLARLHRGSLRLVHVLPSVGVALLAVAGTFLYLPLSMGILLVGVLYGLVVWGDAIRRFRSARMGLMATLACVTMMLGYGTGFLVNALHRGWSARKRGR